MRTSTRARTHPTSSFAERATAGVGRILTVGTTIERSRTALELADQHAEVFAILGIHPHEASEDHDLDALRDLLAHPRAVAVGETGLDFFRDYAPHDRQRALFRQHLGLAAELGKPVVIHNRAADEAVLEELASFDGTVVLHCFSYPSALPAALERGYYVSFAGNATYKNASELRVAATPSPARPHPHRDRRAVPRARAAARAAERARTRRAHAGGPCAHARRRGGGARGAGRRERQARVRPAVSVAPKKELGQHFLVDENILGVIGRLAELDAGDVVLEVGPGLGVLTRYLAAQVAHVHAVELDRSLEPKLREALAESPNVELRFGDALRLDLSTLDPAPTKLVANLPYNVATPIVAESLDGLPSVSHWTVMVQREVADRFFASPGTKAYGAVSVLVQLAAERTGFHPVARTVFRPRPNVDSALVAFRRTELPENYAWVKRVVGAAFAHRRKTLPNSLELSGLATRAEAAAALERIGRDPAVRAEALEPQEFVELTRAL